MAKFVHCPSCDVELEIFKPTLGRKFQCHKCYEWMRITVGGESRPMPNYAMSYQQGTLALWLLGGIFLLGLMMLSKMR
jgi:hypothetical protein